MTVYVDDAIWRWQGCNWCHLVADNLDELHRFAAALGIKPTSFQSPPKAATPHYDLTAYERVRALALGAVACNRHEIVIICRRLRLSLPLRGRHKSCISLPRPMLHTA